VAEESFGEWLQKQRKAANLTLRELAEKLGVKHSYLSQLENRIASPSEDLARRIAQVFEADEERVVFLARDVARQIREIKEKYPHQAPAYFRRVIREEDSR
jgi:transcriptional regulator with XRE-family HTH domain